jgi:O-antigen/teichoic acid export membrane protein
MSTGLRTTFWLHAIVALVFGIGYLFVPDFVTDFFKFQPVDPFIMHLYGAATLALGLSSILAALAVNYERVDIVLKMEVAYTLMAVLVCLYSIFFNNAPTMTWVAVAIFAVFLVLFGYYYLATRSLTAAERGRPAIQ